MKTKTKAPDEKYDEFTILEILRRQYLNPRFSNGTRYAFLTHVRDATGFQGTRTADAIVVNLWPSDRFQLTGFEVKVSRSDWMKEIADADKAAIFQKRCHQWYLIAPEGVAKLEEIPGDWGFLEVAAAKIRPAAPRGSLNYSESQSKCKSCGKPIASLQNVSPAYLETELAAIAKGDTRKLDFCPDCRRKQGNKTNA